MKASSHKSSALKGRVSVPGDKSISHRALIFGSQTIEQTEIAGLLESEDVINTAKSLRALGVDISQVGDKWVVSGVGVGGLTAADDPLDMGNSGTGVRLMMGLVAPYAFETKFIGDGSLSGRPMGRVIEPLLKMGCEIEAQDGGKLPLTIKGNDDMFPIEYTLPVASAQVKSCVLLAALNIAGNTVIIEPEATRDHTEKMLEYLGSDIEITRTDGVNNIKLSGQPELTTRNIIVPSDPSSAAFLVVAALIVPDSEVIIGNVLINPLRSGIFTTLLEMGADITFENKRIEAGEEIADITAKYSNLHGINVPAERAPSMIDEYPILAVAASFASGKTVMNGVGELRVKESDRLAAVSIGLTACGVKNDATDDCLTVYGGQAVNGGAFIEANLDHRIAMAFLVMGMVSQKPIEIDDVSVINTSFPDFINLVNGLGCDIRA